MASVWHLICDVVNEEFSSSEKKTLRLVSRLFSINMLIENVRVEAPGEHPWIRSGKLRCEGATLENCVALDISEWDGRLSSLPSVKALTLKSSQIDSLDGFPGVVEMVVKADGPFVDIGRLEGRRLRTLIVEGECEVFICTRPVNVYYLKVNCSKAIIDASRMTDIDIDTDDLQQTVELKGTSGPSSLIVGVIRQQWPVATGHHETTFSTVLSHHVDLVMTLGLVDDLIHWTIDDHELQKPSSVLHEQRQGLVVNRLVIPQRGDQIEKLVSNDVSSHLTSWTSYETRLH